MSCFNVAGSVTAGERGMRHGFSRTFALDAGNERAKQKESAQAPHGSLQPQNFTKAVGPRCRWIRSPAAASARPDPDLYEPPFSQEIGSDGHASLAVEEHATFDGHFLAGT